MDTGDGSIVDGGCCTVCGGSVRQVFTARVLGRHEVAYFFCRTCQHLRTETPYWEAEAYAEAISAADTGIVARNVTLSRILAGVIYKFFGCSGEFLDTAGGTGLLVRLMRDIGFRFRWEDVYCGNVFARGFEADPGSSNYDAVIAVEVLEHIARPIEFVRSCLSRSKTRTFIFTTELFDGSPPDPTWWYYSFPTGQHVSFFTLRTLGTIADMLGVYLVSSDGVHMFTEKRISVRQYKRVVGGSRKRRSTRTFEKKMDSLTWPDHEEMLKRSGYVESGA